MEAILLAISEGVNVVGCIAWAITDNLEWADGELLFYWRGLWGDVGGLLTSGFRLQSEVRAAVRELDNTGTEL